MPPRGVKSSKRKRQYEHIKESERGNPRAEEIAARTVNKQRAQAGETKSKRGRKKRSAKKSSGGRKASSSRTRSRASSNKRSSSTSRKRGTRKSSSRGRKK